MTEGEEKQDLIVIGGGLAGLVAALRACELGLRPLLLEKGMDEGYACNSRQSGGILHIGFHDPFRPAEELVALIGRLTDGEAQPDLAQALAGHTSRLITWLQGHGTRFMRFNQQEGYRWCMAPPRALKAGIDWQGRGPDLVMRDLLRQLREAGGKVVLGARARELIIEAGRCTGVRGELGGQPQNWRAGAVLIADGGFQSSREEFEARIGPDFDQVFQRGARTGMGDGMRMAVAAGADLTATNRFYGHVLCADARSNDAVWPYPELDAIATAGIVVDRQGQRRVDEGRTGVFLANALAQLPSGTECFAIFDAAIWEGPGRSARIPANPLLEQAGGTVYRAETPEALAQLIGVSPEGLVQSLGAYHRALEAGALEGLEPPRSSRIAPKPVLQAPFMAIKLLPGITYTMGGIRIDGAARVLGRDGAPIAGLYAAGAATGGIEGGTNAVYIGGLVKAGVFGLLAAEDVAQQLGRGAAAGSLLAGAQTGSGFGRALGASSGAAAGSGSGAGPAAPAGAPSGAGAELAARGAGPGSGSAFGAAAVVAEPQGLDRYPVLKQTLRHGGLAAWGLGAVAAALVLLLGFGALGLWSVPLALGAGAFAVIAVKSYVELVRLVTDMLISG